MASTSTILQVSVQIILDGTGLKPLPRCKRQSNLEVIREVTTQGKTSYGCIQSTKYVIIRDSVDESPQKGSELEGSPPKSNTDLDESDDEIESQPSASNSDAKDLT